MTRYEKLAISLPSWVAKNARSAVKAGEAPSLSAYVVTALEEKMKPGDLLKLVQEWLLESGGPTTPEEKRQVDEELGFIPRRSSRKSKTATKTSTKTPTKRTAKKR